MALIKAADEALGKDLLQRGEKKTYKRDYFTECNQVETCTECRYPNEDCCPTRNNMCRFRFECRPDYDDIQNSYPNFKCLPPGL